MKFFAEKPESTSKEKVLDTKTLLKLARQYIDDKNIKKAQQCCRKVLRKNHDNYMALVLLGKSFGRSDEAPPYYEKAIELKPEQPLAWQGLAHYYEGKEDEAAYAKLMNIYQKILSLDIEEDYAHKTIRKHSIVGSLLKTSDTISFIIQYIKEQDNDNLKKTAKIELLQLLQSNIYLKNADLPDAIDYLKSLRYNDLSNDHSELILLGKLILRNYEFVTAVKYIIGLAVFPKSLLLKQWLCKLLCEIFIAKNTYHGFDIDKYLDKLVLGLEKTKYGGILIATTYYRKNKFEQAYQKCISVIKVQLDVIEEMEAIFLLNCSKKTPNRIRTKNLCKYFLRKENLNNVGFIMTMNISLLVCSIEERDINKSLLYLKKIPTEKLDSNILTGLGDLFLELDYISDVAWELLNSTDYLDLFKALALIKSKKFTEAIDALQAYDKHPIKYYYLAIAYWFIDADKESLENFEKAAKLITDHPKIFYCLGVHYFQGKDDIEESKRCFEKSYNLCSTDINVVKMLSIIYARLGQVSLEFDLLQTAFETPQTKEFWVCVRLGRICYTRNIMDDALLYLQAAASFHPNNIAVQEMIGDVYFNKKEYEEALEAYNNVIQQINDNAVFFKCLNRVGFIYSEQMFYQKAIFIFDNILDSDPSNVEALKGITENRIIYALKHVANDLHKDAREQMQLAVDRITTAMSLGIKDLIFWTLNGDVLVFMTRLPSEYSYATFENEDREIRKDKIEMYRMAIESYSNIIKFRDSSALFKCAVTFFEYYCETKNKLYCKTSYNLAVLYMKVNPNIWLIWDFLGKVCYHLDKCETAYYCYTKALSLYEDSEFKVWCELGLFYLKLDKHQLAAHKHLIERLDLSTIAPTLTKEELSNTILISDDCDYTQLNDMNLYDLRDAHKFEFKDWIRTYNPPSTEPSEPTFDCPIETLKIIPNAAEIIEWYLSFEEETVWSCWSLGNLQESKQLFAPALRYYDRACAIANDKVKNEMLSHKGRVLMKMHEYEEAVSVYNSLREKNLKDTCALAVAFFKMKNYKKSYASYNKALSDLCETDDQRVNVLIAMSNVAYRLNGLCEGAMLLLRAVKIKCGDGQDFNLPFLKSYVFSKVDIQLVSHVMSAYAHKHIDKTTWWYFMSLNYLREISKYAKLTRACVKRAIRVNTLPCRTGKLYAMISIAEFYVANRNKALNYATRALKLSPVHPELWAILILCISADKAWPRKAFILRIVIDTVRRVLNLSQSMDRWLTRVEEETIGIQRRFNYTFTCSSISPRR